VTFAFGPEARDITILRTRGVWNVQGQGLANGEAVMFAMGLMVANQTAASTGAIPFVIDDAEDDMWYFHDVSIVEGSQGGTANVVSIVQQREIDSKAMRKIPAGSDFVAAFQVYNISSTAASNLQIDAWFRTLLKTS